MVSEAPSVASVAEATTAQSDSQDVTKPLVEGGNTINNVDQAEQSDQTEPAVLTKEEAFVDGSSNRSEASQTGTNGPLAGRKRGMVEDEHASTASNTGYKKQKTEELDAPPPTTTGDAGLNVNGQKKKAGRPKKGTTNAAKQAPPQPTEGIGSRTRSRTKAKN